MKSARATIVILLVTGIVSGVMGQQNLSANKGAKLDAPSESLVVALSELMKKGDVPGMSIAVIRDGKLAWNRGFGVKNSSTKEAVTEETVFEAASLTKPVFAYAVLKLVYQGKLDLDMPLNK